MEKIITYETLRSFAYSNGHLISGTPKGVCISFFGLGTVSMINEDSDEAGRYASEGILLLQPYLDPWAWMNRQAVDTTDEILDTVFAHYGTELPVCSSGGSMGGQSALVFTVYSRHRIVSCAVNCPVCDLPFHFTERPDLPRTLYSSLFWENCSLQEALESRSPIHLADRFPRIPYCFFHCTADRSVNKALHSDKLVPVLRAAGHQVVYIAVPDKGHCQLTPEAAEAYHLFISGSF